MSMINENEQWLLDGDCNKCRREKYCNKVCTARKRYATSRMASAVMSAMLRPLLGKQTNGEKGKE